MSQSRGTSSGFFLDPESLDPLFGNAMEETLKLLSEQFEYGHRDELTGECLALNFELNQGKCALTYNWGNQILFHDSSYEIAVAPTPGSKRVLDRSTGRLVKCTSTLCPFGSYHDDIGIVNRAPYAAFGGWGAGVSSVAPEGNQHATADFFAYVANSMQSLGDVLPNERSSFAQPYRYSHMTSSNWIEAGFDAELATSYTQSIRQINSENTALELRVPPANALREVIDEEVFGYLRSLSENPSTPLLRKIVASRMEQRVRDVIFSEEQVSDVSVSESYQTSIGFTSTSDLDAMNYIDEDYRGAGWGLGGLICFSALFLIFWTLRYRNDRVMKAFQPFLLIQSAVGLFLLGGTIIPLGFDDSLFSPDVLNITCMLTPWIYISGFTIFFSSVYCKIREGLKIYKEPHKYNVLLVEPASAMRLCFKLLFLNGTILALWTIVDPLKWERIEVDGGMTFEDGTVETYGVCKGEDYASLAFALILFALNLMIATIATYQAFKCRFLVLEYNEMQWLLLSLFPFVEVWLIGGPLVGLSYDDPTIQFVILSMMITASSVAAALSVFAPKDWYIRKFKDIDAALDKNAHRRTSSAGILVLKHPTVS
jgi:hypothetical protein